MKEEIKKNLDSLKKELDKLAPAIEHLQIADKNATALVNSFKSIHSVYELHLLSLEELLVASNKEHLNQIAKELNASSNKLNNLGDTVSNSFKGLEKDVTNFLDNHKSLATETGNLTSKIDNIDFPKRLDSIEKTVKETIAILNNTRESTLEELKKASEIITKADFDGRFKKLKVSIESSVKSNEYLANSIEKQKISQTISELQVKILKEFQIEFAHIERVIKLFINEIAKSIHDLNLPIRMNKLDANISSILSAIQNVQAIIESVERNIDDKLKEAADKQISTLSAFQEKLLQNIADLDQKVQAATKKQQTNTYITWALIIIGIVTLILLVKHSC